MHESLNLAILIGEKAEEDYSKEMVNLYNPLGIINGNDYLHLIGQIKTNKISDIIDYFINVYNEFDEDSSEEDSDSLDEDSSDEED